MKGQLLMRELSTGDFFLFATKTKNLYLIDGKYMREWKSSDQNLADLQKMLKARKVRRFTKVMLEQLRRAVSHIDFKI